MSSTAPSVAPQPNAPAFEGIRRLPVRDAQPPFDDELMMQCPATVDPRQGALTLAYALPNGLPATPQLPSPLPRHDEERTQHLRLVPSNATDDDAIDAGATLQVNARRRPARELGDDEFGPRQTPRAQLPDPKPWAGRLVQAIVEVVSGARPVTQLVRWTSADVYESVQIRMRKGPVVPAPMRVGSPHQFAEVVRSVHVSEPIDGIAEICAILQRGRRCRAIALRLEGLDGRWQCTALHIG